MLFDIVLRIAAGGEIERGYLQWTQLPVFIAHCGCNGLMPPINAFALQQGFPNAQLVLYPDANHGPVRQYPDLFLLHATLFLDA